MLRQVAGARRCVPRLGVSQLLPGSLPAAALSTSPAVPAKIRQPTGRQGMPSPWMRDPFFHERGPPPGVDKSLQERLDELYPSDPMKGDRVDIGFAPEALEKAGKGRLSEWRRGARSNKDLEKAAREGTLAVDLGEVRGSWVQSGAVYEDIVTAAELYGVFEDMFGHAFFRPCVMLDIKYPYKDVLVPVHRGNIVKPREAAAAPTVEFPSAESGLWTLVMTGLDSHLQSEDKQYLHWMVTNIRGGDLSTGDLVCDYLQPFPALGTGYHRYTFVLYRQEAPLHLPRLAEEPGSVNLEARTFHSAEFYKEHQEVITPAGLGFFQSDYDSTIRDFFHHKLDMREPRYEYEFPDWYVTPWMFHLNTNLNIGFDEFMDRHRNPKDLEREVLEAKLKHTDPFQGDTEAYMKYPGIHQEEFEEQFPPPLGEKRLNTKQSFKMAQWRRNALQKQRMKERYFRSTDHSDLRRDPAMHDPMV